MATAVSQRQQQQHFDTELQWETPVSNARFAAADAAVDVSPLDLGAVCAVAAQQVADGCVDFQMASALAGHVLTLETSESRPVQPACDSGRTHSRG